MVEHGTTVDFEAESREVREDRVRVSDGGNSIKLRTRSVGKGEEKVMQR